MGKRENFTAERIAGYKCSVNRQQTIYWDGKTPGWAAAGSVDTDLSF